MTDTTAGAKPDTDPGTGEAATDAPPPNPNDVHLTINGKAVVAQKGDLVIKAADDNGEYIPRFCYHNRMEPVGMCRMCLCEVDSGRGPQLVPTCMVTVAPDMKVDSESPVSKKAQEGIIELLLANHPLDCPVCDKGGECPLQDQSYTHGPGESRYVEEKRHWEKPIPISELVFLDRERCILCDRCTRFADEVAGDPLISFTHRGNTTQVNTFPDEPFSSYFSGNTVQICPVGALTARPYRFKARPWDLAGVESTCMGCSIGCRIVVESSRDEIVRHVGVDSEPVNWGWLCDKGRFGYEATSNPLRLTEPLVRDGGELRPASWNGAYAAAAALVTEALAGGPTGIAVLGGTHGTNEDAYTWARVTKEIIGTSRVHAQLGDGLPVGLLDLPRATIAEAANAATIILLGPDLKEELGVLFLRVRNAAHRKRSRIIELSSRRSGLSELAWRTVGHEPGDQLGAVRRALADAAIAEQVASGPVVIIAGRANLAESSDGLVEALDHLLDAVPGAKVLPAFRQGNVVGALQVGLRADDGAGVDDVLRDAADGRIELLVLLGSDPLHGHPDTDLARRALAGAKRIIAVDTFLNDSSKLADVVFAAAAAGEKSGSHTNIEGRVSDVVRKVTPKGTARPDWMIAVELGMELGTDLAFTNVAEITQAIAHDVPAYAGITAAALLEQRDGILAVPAAGSGTPASSAPAPADRRVPARNSYDFRLVVSRVMWDRSVRTTMSPSLVGLARPAGLHLHPLDLDRVGAQPGAEVKVSSSKAAVVLPVVADPAVVRGTAWVPFDVPGSNVGELIDSGSAVTDVRVETL